MPCFSASNVRFISAQEQQKYPMKERAKTAASINYTVYPRFIENAPKKCSQLQRAKGYTPPKMKSMPLRTYVGLKPKTLAPQEYERLKNAAKYISVEERLNALERQEQLTKQLDLQAELARIHFKKIDEERLQKAQTQTMKEDLKDTAKQQSLLERAFIAKHEEEEEVKMVNRIILNAKCHAVRDAQMQEKREIERIERDEKKRLERMVLEGALKDLEKQDCWEEHRKQRNEAYARDIRHQLEVRDRLRYLEAERAEEEARVEREAAAAIKRDEERRAREAWERRQQFRNELNRVVEMSNLFKKMLCEQERESEMRIAAYLRDKREREKLLEHEKQLAKEEFERKQQHLYQLAQKHAESKSRQDEGIFMREQERVERDYRRREREATLRKKQLEREMKEARIRQMQEMKSRQALQIAREEKDFNALIDNLKKEEARLQKREEEREKQRKCYRAAIMRQISDKVMAKRRLLEDERSNANLWLESERQRLANVRAVVNAKLTAMREACLPERYIRDVERQLDRILKTNTCPKTEQAQED